PNEQKEPGENNGDPRRTAQRVAKKPASDPVTSVVLSPDHKSIVVRANRHTLADVDKVWTALNTVSERDTEGGDPSWYAFRNVIPEPVASATSLVASSNLTSMVTTAASMIAVAQP